MSGNPGNWLADAPAWSFAFMLVLARFGAAMALLPGLGESAAPAMVRAGLAFCVTVLLLPGLFPTPPPAPDAGLSAAGMVAAEVATGLWLGWLARLICLALPIAAQFIAYLLGLATVLQPDPELAAQSTALSVLFEIAAPLVILVSGLYTLPLTALAGSYRLVPAGTLFPAADGAAAAVTAMGQVFALALRLASPLVVASVLWHVAIGLLARLVSRLQIYFIAMPGQIAGGLMLFAVSLGVMLAAWQDAVQGSFAGLPGN